jgi:hypothetical protein
MANDYMPATDAGKLTFGENAVALITPAPTTWGLTAPIATQLGTYVTDYGSKLAAATEPATKSRANTFAKNQARDRVSPAPALRARGALRALPQAA